MDTKANPDTQEYPSSPGQWDLGRQLVDELNGIGLKDVRQDENALVYATIPASTGAEKAPVIAFNSHLDTSPETSGANVKPQVIENYSGVDIPLPGDPSKIITVEGNPELKKLHGATLITTDGTTLLGGDDKAGVAIIMEAAETLMENPDIQHGEIRLLFTCDEEIGRGISKVDVPALGAVVGYTLDGPSADFIDVETFSADEATLTIEGINIHPSVGKGRMVNAVRVAAAFLEKLPSDRLSPETTSGREGFLHPYRIIDGQVDKVTIKILLRDFDTSGLAEQAALLREVAESTQAAFRGAKITVDVLEQYRNLGDGLQKEPRAVQLAELAHERLGRTPTREIIRGGTDGSMLTALGLPTPNLSSGQHNPHSPLEWACLDEMVSATDVVIELAKIWAESSGS